MAVDLQGRRLWAGEYEIQEELARGGMAVVYKAYARSLDTTVAIKVLFARFAQEPSFKQRFHAEATSIAALHCPNIIEVHHFGEEDGSPYIAMRFVPGGTLKERVQELGGLMDLRSAARLTAQVASALQYAHDAGLVHLDVKPANVLLGNADWPLLSDFGITRLAGDAREDGHRVAGTPAYMSPEQWQGLDVDGRSDQYSLGLMLYELVTGKRAFTGDTSAELMEQHLHEPPPRPRELNPGIPGPVEEVILRALEKNREDRFPRIGDFGAALVEAVERSRGMQLETKQAIVSAIPNLVALLVLSIVAPFLASLPDQRLPLYRALTLDWPISLVTALLQVALLMGIRWHLIGIITRLLGAIVDAIDRLTRLYIRIGTDPQGLLRVQAWRNAAVGSGEGIVNVAYLFVVYQIVAPPSIKVATLLLNPKMEIWIATAIAGLVLAIAGLVVAKIYRTSGPIIAICALAVCWGLVSAMPMVDTAVYGKVSLQWLAKLGVGLAILVTFLAVRGRVQREVREFAVPIIDQPVRGLQRRRTPEEAAAQRQLVERALNGLVNVVYLIVGYPIIALPLQKVVEAFINEKQTAIVISIAVFLVAALLVNKLRVSSGVVSATLGLLVCAPTLMGLPVFEETLLGSTSLQWAAQIIVALGVLIIFLSIRGQVQAMARQIIVPAIDHQLSSLLTSQDEGQAAARRRVIEGASDMLVNVVYLLVGYFAVVGPVAGAVAGATNLAAVSIAVHALFVLAVLLVLIAFARKIMPAIRPAAPPPPLAPSAEPAAPA